MDAGRSPEEFRALEQEIREIWNQNAQWWDEKVGEGNEFQRILIGPATDQLLDLHPGEQVLDCACGNGAFSRRMAQQGAQVVAFDFSETFLERAKSRTHEHADRIEYRLIDAADEAQLLGLGQGRFDAAVCTMSLMDMAAIDPLISALSKLLKAGGRFVFSVLHPCFNSSSGLKLVAEEEDRDGDLATVFSVKVSRYIRPSVTKGIGIVGQPQPHYYFHRPISLLLNTCFRAGFVVDGVQEPTFEQTRNADRLLSWLNYAEIPPVFVVRMRLLPLLHP